MPDWQSLVRARLSGLKLNDSAKEEVEAELAGHLEDTFELLRAKDLPEQAAMNETMGEVTDWNKLRRQIQVARQEENTMNDRVRQLWLPSFLTMLFSMGLLMLSELFGPKPWVVARRQGWSLIAPALVIYLPWLLSLPVIGAIGAYLSNRAGGSRRVMLSSVLFPVLPYLAFFIVGLPLIVILNDRIAHNVMFSALFIGLFAWVLAPGAALLAGGLLVRLIASRSSASRSFGTR